MHALFWLCHLIFILGFFSWAVVFAWKKHVIRKETVNCNLQSYLQSYFVASSPRSYQVTTLITKQNNPLSLMFLDIGASCQESRNYIYWECSFFLFPRLWYHWLWISVFIGVCYLLSFIGHFQCSMFIACTCIMHQWYTREIQGWIVILSWMLSWNEFQRNLEGRAVLHNILNIILKCE